MGGRGAASGSTTLSKKEKTKIANDIASHTAQDNDRAENYYKNNIEREKKIVSNAKAYIEAGTIKSIKDEWFQEHIKSFNKLKASYSYFKKERRKQGK